MNLVYDLGKCPASWDFLQWLINAKIAVHGKQFDVCFVPGPINGFRRDNVDRPLDARKLILRNVIKPAMRLVGAQEAEVGEEVPLTYATRYAVEFAKRGLKMPQFEVPQEYADEVAADYNGRKLLVITLRETTYYPGRNSNLKAWKDFARRSKQDCIFVRDTAKADEPIEGFETCPRASRDLLYRAALMQRAKCNLQVANGPFILTLYSPTPWLMFGAIRPEVPDYSPGRPEWWDRNMGVPIGRQFPFATDQQRIVWGHDTLANIEDAWDRLSHQSRPPQRRKLTKEWKRQFEAFRRTGDKYLDEQLRIKTIEMYERVDDKPADMIVACNILEQVPDVDAALMEINNLARKQVLITVRPDAIRDEKAWRKLIERRMTIGDFVPQSDGSLVFYCMPGMKVEGVRLGAALDEDERWNHIENALARVSKRIQPAEGHGRRAVIACYGPSLKAYWPKLKDELEQDRNETALVSVSGAHDFLIEHGLIPDYHVECDPRPHKTDNINLPHPKVKYLIASSCHPSLFDRLAQYDVALWHVAAGSNLMRLIDEKREPKETTVSGGGSVGLRSLPLMYRLGYRKVSIYGMDCSFAKVGEDADGKPIVEQWAGKHAGKLQEVVAAECRGEVFLTSTALLAYMGHFFDLCRKLPDLEPIVWGNGLLQATARNVWNPAMENAA